MPKPPVETQKYNIQIYNLLNFPNAGEQERSNSSTIIEEEYALCVMQMTDEMFFH